jgi:hypothetical protein
MIAKLKMLAVAGALSTVAVSTPALAHEGERGWYPGYSHNGWSDGREGRFEHERREQRARFEREREWHVRHRGWYRW